MGRLVSQLGKFRFGTNGTSVFLRGTLKPLIKEHQVVTLIYGRTFLASTSPLNAHCVSILSAARPFNDETITSVNLITENVHAPVVDQNFASINVTSLT